MTTTENPLTLGVKVLGQLMPMHVVIAPTGHIQQTGPTLAKMTQGRDLLGKRVLELFEIRRPGNITTMKGLVDVAGTKLILRFRGSASPNLKGILVGLGKQQGYLLNLSFGISVVDAVREHALTSSDFPPTDLAIELLYLVEAKSAVMNETRKLNSQLHGARAAAEQQALTDTLTGLKNRRALDHMLSRFVERDIPFALMQLDLDYFKSVNDTLGHAAGDRVLQNVAQILVSEVRPEDTVARIGGDEFVLIFDRLVDSGKLTTIGERIIKRLEEPLMFEGSPCQISGSIGVVSSTMSERAPPELYLKRADAALYRSKGRGRACVSFADQCPPGSQN